ncbi:MAG: ATP phosphoribosyltransferase regulatory subunit, partial [Planctomycetota bacterium]
REFFQWNIDIIGVDDVLADAEVIFTTLDYLRAVGLTSGDIKVKTSSRKLLASVLKNIGIREDQLDSLYVLLDKRERLPTGTFLSMLSQKVPDTEMAEKIVAFMDVKTVSGINKVVGTNDEIDEAIDELAMLIHWLDQMGVAEYCQFDASTVRGLAYYTGIVFEVHDTSGGLRAICGGGRFDNLLQDFGGPQIPATGMGMGDCILEILLKQKGLLDKHLPTRHLDYFVAAVGGVTFDDDAGNVKSTPEDETVKLAARLRTMGFCADFSYKSGNLSKQLREASAQNAHKCIIIGEEFKHNNLTVKDMATGDQRLVNKDEFLSGLRV